MKKFLVLSTICMFLVGSLSIAQVPKKISYQGLLTTSTGTPAATGTYTLQFDLYDVPSGGSSLWTETDTGVSVQQGTFSVILGSITPINLPFDETYYLEITATAGPGISSPVTFSPRSEFTSAPYALRADTAEYAKASLGGGVGPYLPLAGGTMTGAIMSTGDPEIKMGKPNLGTGNLNPGTQAFVAGSNNRARGSYSVVSGGGGATAADSNSALGDYSLVSGGRKNVSSGTHNTISGGQGNSATGSFQATVGGGGFNLASGSQSTIAGGNSNSASGDRSTVGGGALNTASGYGSTVAGGGTDTASGQYSAVPGGALNKAAGGYSLAAGYRAKANYGGTFVWADSTSVAGTDFASTRPNQFLIRASGGVGIGTTLPTEQLEVVGNVKVSDTLFSSNLDVEGNAVIGATYSGTFSAPTNGLLVEGNVGIGDGTPPSGIKLYVANSGSTPAGFNRETDDGVVVVFNQDGLTEGSITVSGSTVSYNPFTGSHFGWIDESILHGTLVSLTGINRRYRDDPNSEIIYGITPSAKANDQACMGAYLGLQEPSQPASSENPHLIMAVGNGEMWVVDEGGDIQPGDYLISSSTPGCAMKYDPTKYSIGYIVARAADGITWEDGSSKKKISVFFESFMYNGKTIRLEQRINDLENKLQSLIDERSRTETFNEQR